MAGTEQEQQQQLKLSEPQCSIMEINNHCYPLLDWDPQSFGLYNSVMQTPPFYSSEMSSSGYLQDAIIKWSDRYKQRRMLVFPQDHSQSEKLLQNYWNWNCYEYTPSNTNLVLDEPINSSLSSVINEEASLTKSKTEEARPIDEQDVESKRRRRKLAMGVAYPFAVVKPSGVEGDVTLKDINKRILKKPTRPIQHPVGDFARVSCASENGSGPSGKAVVALTKIHTQGRGTITIIRTRG